MVIFCARPGRADRRRRISLGAGAVAVLLSALIGAWAPPVAAADPTIGPSAPPAGTAPVLPVVPPSMVGGPRMAETGLVTAPGAPAVPATTAASWVLADAETGQVIAAKNPHGRYRPASTLKTLLALTMAPRLDPKSTITADKSDENVEGTRVGLVATQAYSVDDLWYGLLLRSGNDAANALARGGAGNVERGVRMMQAEAQRLQSNDTTVVNPSGLDADGQFASSYDLALWGRAALARRDLRTYVSSIQHAFPGNQTASATKKTSKPFQVYTENRLLLRGFPGAIGVKTGYTTLAQNTLIAAAQRDGRTLIASLMFTPFGQITNEAGKLLDYGFATAGKLPPVGQLVEPLSPAVTSPEDAGFVAAPANKGPAVAAATEDSRSPHFGATPASESQSLRWSAVAGSALLGVLILLGAARMIASRRRYRRAGAYRF